MATVMHLSRMLRLSSFRNIGLAAIISTAVCAHAETRTARQEIIALEEERRQAVLHNDVDTLQRQYADGMTVVDNSGAFHVNRANSSATLNAAANRTTTKWVSSDMNVKAYGDAAIVFQRSEISDVLGGQLRDFTGRLTHVWVK